MASRATVLGLNLTSKLGGNKEGLDSGRDKLRKKVERMHGELRCIGYFVYPINRKRRADIDRFLGRLPAATKLQLRAMKDAVEAELAKVRREFGVAINRTELLSWLKEIEGAPAGKSVLIPIYVVRSLFRHADKSLPPHDAVPHHAMLMIELSGTQYEDREFGFDVRLLEASLYEDMCYLFNLAKTANDQANGHGRRYYKTQLTLGRSTVITAINFVESYVNGIAFDYQMDHQTLDDRTKILLSEWDHLHDRWRAVSLRDKLLQYPRITTGAEHPPLQESNCPEFAFIVEEAKKIRDSIVHASPAPSPGTQILNKELATFDIAFPLVERVVDNAIGLVRKVEVAVNGDDRRVGWLLDRGANGMFPDEAFN